ncbi:hypothetical protein ACT1UH_03265 [Mycoplasma sp. 332]|uniref:hypothetical protein n=1 Tax=Mycoplasma sp. 332 TaxID=3458236 RepID=UPI00403534B0
MEQIDKSENNYVGKLYKMQSWASICFIVFLCAFISILLAIYLNGNENNYGKWTSNPVYIVITILFIFSIVFVVSSSILGLKYAKKNNNARLHIYFLLSAIFIIPFLSLYCMIVSAIKMYDLHQKIKKEKHGNKLKK